MIKRNAIGNFFARVLGQTEPLRDNLSINEGLGACGDQTILENGILFEGNTANIFLGRKVRVASGSRLVCTDEKSQIRVGDGTQIHWGACLETGAGGQILLGKFNSVNPYCIVYGHGGVRTGDYVRIAAQTVIIPADHVFSDPNVAITKQGLTKIGITIEDDVWIGAGCRILDGVHIGKGCVIGLALLLQKAFPQAQ